MSFAVYLIVTEDKSSFVSLPSTSANGCTQGFHSGDGKEMGAPSFEAQAVYCHSDHNASIQSNLSTTLFIWQCFNALVRPLRRLIFSHEHA